VNDTVALVVALLIAWAIGLCSPCVRPTSARCPPQHDLRTGIRADGRFECWPQLRADPEWDDTRDGTGVQSSVTIPGRIYCTGGTRPIVIDYRTVGCQR
jgi:hypothetical protein